MSQSSERWLETHLRTACGHHWVAAFDGEHQGIRFGGAFGPRRSSFDGKGYNRIREGGSGDHPREIILQPQFRQRLLRAKEEVNDMIKNHHNITMQ